MYSTAFWCLFVVLLFFWLYCVTAVTPFIERSEGWSLRSGRVLDQSQQECHFFRRNSNPLQIFQLQPKGKTSSSSLGDRLEKRFIISSSNRAICAGLRGTSGFRAVPVTTVAPTKLICIMTISTYTTGAGAEMTRQLGSCTVKKFSEVWTSNSPCILFWYLVGALKQET